MQSGLDNIILEDRQEISRLQDICEIAIENEDLPKETKRLAKELSGILESMYLSW